MVGPDATEPLSAFLDTNVLIRHLTGDPPRLAQRATRCLRAEDELFLTDLVAAECVYLLESVYDVDRYDVAELMRSVVGFKAVKVNDESVLYHALELYEQHSVGFADAYLAARARHSGIGRVMSFDRDIDKIPSVERIAP